MANVKFRTVSVIFRWLRDELSGKCFSLPRLGEEVQVCREEGYQVTPPVIIQYLLESVWPDLPSLANFLVSLHGEGF